MPRFISVALALAVVLMWFAVPAGATSFFDIFTDLPSLPPYPYHDQGIGHMAGGQVALDLVHRTGVGQISVTPEAFMLPCELASSNGMPPGQDQWNVDSFFDITYRPDLVGGEPWPTGSFFDINYQVEIPGGGISQLVPRNPALPPTDPAHFFDINYLGSIFDITYRVEVGPGGGCHELHMHGEFQPGLRILTLWINHQASGESSFNVIAFLDLPGPPVDPSLPVLRTTTRGQFLPGAVAAESATWGKVKSLYQR